MLHLLAQTVIETSKTSVLQQAQSRHVRQSSECCESCSAVLNRDSNPHVKTTAATLYVGSCLTRGRRKSRFLIEEFVHRLVFVQEIQSKPKIFIKADLAPKICGCLFLYRKNISDGGQNRNDICCKTGTFLRLKLPL